jgi:hypothetical protein
MTDAKEVLKSMHKYLDDFKSKELKPSVYYCNVNEWPVVRRGLTWKKKNLKKN